MAGRVAQVVAAAYFTGRGLEPERVEQLTKTPDLAARALRNVRTQRDVLTIESDVYEEQRVREWTGLSPDEFDPTEHWLDYYHAHPESYDLDVEDKEEHFRQMAAKLVQFDTRVVGSVQQRNLEHALSGAQQPVTGELAETVKKDRHPETLQRFLAAREYQMERHVPPHFSGYRALFGEYEKSVVSVRFPGTTGAIAKPTEVGSMGLHSNPARSPGDDPWQNKPPQGHPGTPENRSKDKRRRNKGTKKKKKELEDAGQASRDVSGQARGAETYREPDEKDREPDRNRVFLESEAERRTVNRRLVMRPDARHRSVPK
jgi:hypothetical protein